MGSDADETLLELKDMLHMLSRLLEETKQLTVEDKKRLHGEMKACREVFAERLKEAHFHQGQDGGAWGDLDDKDTCADLLDDITAYVRCYGEGASDQAKQEHVDMITEDFSALPQKTQKSIFQPLFDFFKDIIKAVTRVSAKPSDPNRPSFFNSSTSGDKPFEDVDEQQKKTGGAPTPDSTSTD
ncbi:MAG: hypothetical protein K0U37_08025 [Gammaproteobacteria bacterium]|nr:hypothetical protein [Gammaproteobacteria bacterium]